MRYVDELTAAVREQLALAYRAKDLVAWALRQKLAEGITIADLRADARAALTVFLVTLPLVLAFGSAIGVPPQYTIYGAIVSSILAALFGGSQVVVTGPSAGMAVVLAPVAAKFGVTGMLVATLLAGGILILFGLLRLGRIVQFIPHPVTTGLVAAIAVLTFVLGLRMIVVGPALVMDIADNLQALESASRKQWPQYAVGALTLGLMLVLHRSSRKLPAAAIAVGIASLAAYALSHWLPESSPATIYSSFDYPFGAETMHGIPPLPPTPHLPWREVGIDFLMIKLLLPSALAIAMLAAISSLTSGVVAEGITSQSHEPNAILIGQGIGNAVAPLFGGVACSGVIARTSLNIRSGAKTPFAAAMQGILLLVAVAVLAPILSRVPIAALGAVLLVVAYNMVDLRHIARLLRVAPTSDVATMITCFAVTLIVDVPTAIAASVVLAALLLMRRMMVLSSATLATAGNQAMPIPPGVRLYEINGPLFFGAANTAFASMRRADEGISATIVSMRGVPAMDATGLVALESTLQQLSAGNHRVVLCGMSPEVQAFLGNAGIRPVPGKLVFAPDLAASIAVATAAG